MGALIAAGSGALLVAGVVLVLTGLQHQAPAAPSSTPLSIRLMARWKAVRARRRIWVVSCLVAGVMVGTWTGWLAAVVLIPLALLGLPHLLSEPPNPEVEILAALDRWLRFLGPSIATGKSIRDAIIATRAQVPPVLTTPVARVVARLDLGWTTRNALIAMGYWLPSRSPLHEAGSVRVPCSPHWPRTPRCGCAPCAKSPRNGPNPGPWCVRSLASHSRYWSWSGCCRPDISAPTQRQPGSCWR